MGNFLPRGKSATGIPSKASLIHLDSIADVKYLRYGDAVIASSDNKIDLY